MWRDEKRKKKSAVVFEHYGRGLAWKHCVPICELWESQGLWEGLQVGRHWLLKITTMTSSSLCRLRHKTQSNETRKGRKRQGGEVEEGVLLMVRYTSTGTRRIHGSNGDFIWINYILITVTNFFICVSGILTMKFLILLSLHFFLFFFNLKWKIVTHNCKTITLRGWTCASLMSHPFFFILPTKENMFDRQTWNSVNEWFVFLL